MQDRSLDSKPMAGYYKLSDHFKWALSHLFDTQGHPRVITLEVCVRTRVRARAAALSVYRRSLATRCGCRMTSRLRLTSLITLLPWRPFSTPTAHCLL
ncbi:hypothetical protein EON67_06270 [archaeon]|nr:MAG: hypothetical protein EON67_06270 [archaeon]